MSEKEDTLVKELKQINTEVIHGPEVAHMMADKALLRYIGDKEVSLAFDAIHKWYG